MLLLLVLLSLCFLIQAGAWAWVGAGIRRVREAESAPEPASPLPISVVIAAHNEADHLGALLDALAMQTHEAFEVVIVDDRSTDATAEIVRQRAENFPVPLRLVQVREDDTAASPQSPVVPLPPKKNALTRAIEAAAHDRLAFTDADCTPTPGWLVGLAREATARPEAILVGYGPLTGEGVLGRFCRYETARTAALSIGAIGHGKGWHAVGRNLSYPRTLWREGDGFYSHAAALSGDDDLFVQHARQSGAEMRFVLDPETFVPSPAPSGWRAFWRQKRRHASAGAHYATGVLAGLGALQISSLALWVGAPVLHVVWGVPWGWGFLGASLLLQRGVLLGAWDSLGARADLRLWHPVLEAIHTGYQLVAAVFGALPVPRRW
ncbi:MAG: glycosyltransferase [Bacteroidota bacterium]